MHEKRRQQGKFWVITWSLAPVHITSTLVHPLLRLRDGSGSRMLLPNGSHHGLGTISSFIPMFVFCAELFAIGANMHDLGFLSPPKWSRNCVHNRHFHGFVVATFIPCVSNVPFNDVGSENHNMHHCTTHGIPISLFISMPISSFLYLAIQLPNTHS